MCLSSSVTIRRTTDRQILSKQQQVSQLTWNNSQVPLMVYSYWLSSGPGQGLVRIGCMVLRRTFHTAPEQGPGRMGYGHIFQVLKLFQVVFFNDIAMAFGCPVPVPDTANLNGFCIISVPGLVPDTASVNGFCMISTPVLVLDTANVVTASHRFSRGSLMFRICLHAAIFSPCPLSPLLLNVFYYCHQKMGYSHRHH